jgi:hypothetical protein
MSVATLEIVGTKQPSKDNEGSFSDKRSLESVKASSKLVTGEDAGSKDAHAEFATSDRNSGWHSSIGIFSSEVENWISQIWFCHIAYIFLCSTNWETLLALGGLHGF